jgi:hypothetical protein
MASDVGIVASAALSSGYYLACGVLSVDHVTHVRERLVSIFDDYEARANRDSRSCEEIVGPRGGWLRYQRAQQMEDFHATAYDNTIVSLVSRFIGSDYFCHPRRLVHGLAPGAWIPPHQAYYSIQGTQDVVIAWVPLTEEEQDLYIHTPPDLRLLPLHWVDGRSAANDTALDDPHWKHLKPKIGDVVFYHSLTNHYVGPNITPSTAYSLEFRYQRTDDALCLASLRPHHFPRIPGWDILSSKWTQDYVRIPKRPKLIRFRMPTTIETWHEQLPLRADRLLPVLRK